MDIVAATTSYETWLSAQIPVVVDDLAHKHKLMAGKDRFLFFRATYYRWLQQLLHLASELKTHQESASGTSRPLSTLEGYWTILLECCH